MMAPTHVLAGAAFASLTVAVAPEYALIAVIAAGLGGLFPDLDIYSDHRRTLHFPIYYAVAGGISAAIALVEPNVVTVATTWFLVAAGIHCAMDAVGGGLELRPWEETSEQAVFSHYHGRWIPPRRWIRYDGAPEDLVLATAFAVVPIVTFGANVWLPVGGLLVVSAVYTLFRKSLASVWAQLAYMLPSNIRGRIPDRFFS